MATSSYTFEPPPVPLDRPAVFTAVVRHEGGTIPNVVCEDIQWREGADPGSARFRYLLSDVDPESPYPIGFEEIYPIDAVGPYIVKNDDRIGVLAFDDQGNGLVMFDGFAQIPEVSLGKDEQSVTFQAIGVAGRLWDQPIEAAVYRDANLPRSGDIFVTDAKVRFNPNDDGVSTPNATPDGADVGPDGKSIDGVEPEEGEDPKPSYPAFLDKITDDEDSTPRFWTLGMAVRYLILRNNKDEKYVKNPDLTKIDDELKAIKPKEGKTYDPAFPDTYTTEDIIVRDYDASNKPWIEAVDELVSSYGFSLVFDLETNEDGEARTSLDFRRRDGLNNAGPKALRLQAYGDNLNPGLSNVGSLSLQRDLADVFNVVEIETDPIRYEISIVLAPGFPIDAADGATAASRKKYESSAWQADTTQKDREKYRLFIADECGSGHWNRDSGEFDNTVYDALFADVFGTDDSSQDGKKTYANRYRPGDQTLFSLGEDKQPLKAQLWISRDYKGKSPRVWDGSGTWQPITKGYKLLKDRLGIMVEAENPNQWDIGPYIGTDTAKAQNSSTTLRAIESLTNPAAAESKIRGWYYLRLTCVIEGDKGLDVRVDRRPASPTSFDIVRRIDCRDHFRKEVVDLSSDYFDPERGDAQYATRDDTDRARAHAEAMQSAHELAKMAGSVTIPRFTLAYGVGDRIGGIDGRGVSFAMNAGSEQGEGDRYPTVVGVRWTFGKEQMTILQLSDYRAESIQV